MKQGMIIIFLICLACTSHTRAGDRDPFFHTEKSGTAGERKTAEPKSRAPRKEESVSETGFLQQISYSLGYDIVRHISGQVDLDMAYFLKGIEDAKKGSPALTEDQMKQMLMAYQRLARQKAREASKAVLEKNQAQGNIFLEGNKLKEGVVTLSSGLQYRVLKKGDGPLPGEESTVECHYKGQLLDGREFDSSYARGRPAVFQVDKVIPGWSQALTRMRVGSKWVLYIPSELAYGEQGAGDIIEPGHTLIFEVELLGILE